MSADNLALCVCIILNSRFLEETAKVNDINGRSRRASVCVRVCRMLRCDFVAAPLRPDVVPNKLLTTPEQTPSPLPLNTITTRPQWLREFEQWDANALLVEHQNRE